MDKQEQAEKQGIPQYRCQRCGETKMKVHPDPRARLVPVKILHLFATNPFALEIGGVQQKAIHECEDGGEGLAVIVGFFPEERLPELEAATKKNDELKAKKREQLASSSN